MKRNKNEKQKQQQFKFLTWLLSPNQLAILRLTCSKLCTPLYVTVTQLSQPTQSTKPWKTSWLHRGSMTRKQERFWFCWPTESELVPVWFLYSTFSSLITTCRCCASCWVVLIFTSRSYQGIWLRVSGSVIGLCEVARDSYLRCGRRWRQGKWTEGDNVT